MEKVFVLLETFPGDECKDPKVDVYSKLEDAEGERIARIENQYGEGWKETLHPDISDPVDGNWISFIDIMGRNLCSHVYQIYEKEINH